MTRGKLNIELRHKTPRTDGTVAGRTVALWVGSEALTAGWVGWHLVNMADPPADLSDETKEAADLAAKLTSGWVVLMVLPPLVEGWASELDLAPLMTATTLRGLVPGRDGLRIVAHTGPRRRGEYEAAGFRRLQKGRRLTDWVTATVDELADE